MSNDSFKLLDSQDEQVLSNFLSELEETDAPALIFEQYRLSYPQLLCELETLFESKNSHMPAASQSVAEMSTLRHGSELRRQLKSFRLLKRIGQGGMGEVFLAVQEPLERRVAVKIMRRGRGSILGYARFRREQQVLARIQNSNIVPIYYADIEGPFPFFAMEYVDGAGLDRVLARITLNVARSMNMTCPSLIKVVQELRMECNSDGDGSIRDSSERISLDHLPTNHSRAEGDQVSAPSAMAPSAFQRSGPVRLDEGYFRAVAALMIPVADAVDAAHERGILHRDLKPSNIMLDEHLRPHITDFGLAGEVGVVAELDPTFKRSNLGPDPTAVSGLLGTPAYMAPEQFDSKADVRTDVWGLGMVLYEAMTMHRPFPADNFASQRAVTCEAPARRMDEFVRGVPDDLAAICLKCLEKDPVGRYQTAGELALDLRRYRDGFPVLARQLNWRAEVIDRFEKWRKREPREFRMVGTITACIIGLVLFGLVLVGYATHQREQRRVATARELSFRSLAATADQAGRLQDAARAIQARNFSEARERIGGITNDRIGWETRRLQCEAELDVTVIRQYCGHFFGVLDGRLNADGSQLVSTGADGLVILWDARSGQMIRHLTTGHWATELARPLHFIERPTEKLGEYFSSVRWRGATSKIVAAGLDGNAVEFDAETGSRRRLFPENEAHPADPLLVVGVDHDGGSALFGASSGNLLLVELTTGKTHKSAGGSNGDTVVNGTSKLAAVSALAWSQASKRWIVGRADGRIDVLDNEALKPRQGTGLRVPGPIWAMDVGEFDGRECLAVACGLPAVSVYGIARDGQLEPIRTVELPSGDSKPQAIQAVRFAPDKRHLHAATDRGQIARIDLSRTEVEWVISAIERDPRIGESFDIAPQPGSTGSSVPLVLRRRSGFVETTPDGNELLAGGRDLIINAWKLDSSGRKLIRTLDAVAGKEPRIAFDQEQPDRLWCMSSDGQLRVIDLNSGATVDSVAAHASWPVVKPSLGADSRRGTLAISASNGQLMTAGADGRGRAWELRKNRIHPAETPVFEHSCGLVSVAISPDGQLAAAVDVSGSVVVWDLASGKLVFSPLATSVSDREPLSGDLAFNVDGTRLAAFGTGQTCYLFDTKQWRRLPDQGWVAGKGGTALGWHTRDPGILLLTDDYPRFAVHTFPGHKMLVDSKFRPTVSSVAIRQTPDAKRQVILESNGAFTFLDAENLWDIVRFRNPTRSESDRACDLAMSTARDRLVIASNSGHLEVWDIPAKAAPGVAPVTWEKPRKWQVTQLVTSDGFRLRLSESGVLVDAHDRVQILAIENKPSHYRAEGDVVWLHESDKGVERELISGAGRTEPAALTLIMGPASVPIALFRERIAVRTGYDSKLRIARRASPEAWDFEELPETANAYLHMFPILDGERVRAVLHFESSNFNWMISDRDDQGKWTTRILNGAMQGDGRLASVQRRARNNDFVAIFTPNRINRGFPTHFCRLIDGGTKVVDRGPVDPSSTFGERLELLPDGTPVLLRQPRDPTAGAGFITRLTKDGWRDYVPLPVLEGANFAIGPDGRVHLASFDNPSRELRYYVFDGANWLGSVIADSWESGPPTTLILRVDSKGRPIVLASRSSDPETSWLAVYRPVK